MQGWGNQKFGKWRLSRTRKRFPCKPDGNNFATAITTTNNSGFFNFTYLCMIKVWFAIVLLAFFTCSLRKLQKLLAMAARRRSTGRRRWRWIKPPFFGKDRFPTTPNQSQSNLLKCEYGIPRNIIETQLPSHFLSLTLFQYWEIYQKETLNKSRAKGTFFLVNWFLWHG